MYLNASSLYKNTAATFVSVSDVKPPVTESSKRPVGVSDGQTPVTESSQESSAPCDIEEMLNIDIDIHDLDISYPDVNIYPP